uniref:Maturase K n=1 Tax=Romanomermis culicivorax TaxID=13658 RepID=A0A915L713_ROMCU
MVKARYQFKEYAIWMLEELLFVIKKEKEFLFHPLVLADPQQNFYAVQVRELHQNMIEISLTLAPFLSNILTHKMSPTWQAQWRGNRSPDEQLTSTPSAIRFSIVSEIKRPSPNNDYISNEKIQFPKEVGRVSPMIARIIQIWNNKMIKNSLEKDGLHFARKRKKI